MIKVKFIGGSISGATRDNVHLGGDVDMEFHGTEIFGAGRDNLHVVKPDPYLQCTAEEGLRIYSEFAAAKPATEAAAVETLTKSGASKWLIAGKTVVGLAKYLFEHPQEVAAAIQAAYKALGK